MNLIGPFAQRLALRRLRTMRRHASAPREPQQRVFERLMRAMQTTSFGRPHGFASVRTPADLARAVPLQNYQSLAPWWQRARNGERDVVWPGRIRHWAISSGTTAGEKLLPVSAQTIANNKRGGFDSLVPHLAEGNGALFGGKLLFLGGSTELQRNRDLITGDNTGIMATHVPRCLRGLHAPDARIRAMSDWEQKVAAAAAQSATVDLRMLAGVPSWIVLFGEAVLAHCRQAGRDVRHLTQVWPNLQLFVHGGVTFAPYAQRMRALVGGDIRYTDTYSASEGGMLAVQDLPDDPGMLPLADRSTFFEFVPTSELASASPCRLGLHELDVDVDYAVAMTTDSGIVSYLVGDVIRIVSRAPLRLVFAGRTAHTLNAFGEHLSGGELDRAIATAADSTDAIVDEFAVAVDYPLPGEPMGGHRYLVEFHRPPTALATFAEVLDRTLKSGNADYTTHRSFGLRPPVIEPLPAGTFLAFLRRKGKVGGQHKAPRVLDEAASHELRAAITPATSR